MTEQQQEMLREATQAVLDRRFAGSVNGAHRKLGVSRETLTKMLDGRPPALEVVERIARQLKEPVNKWRSLCGYEAIEEVSGRTRLADRLFELRASYPQADIQFPSFKGGADALTPEMADAWADDLEKKLRGAV